MIWLEQLSGEDQVAEIQNWNTQGSVSETCLQEVTHPSCLPTFLLISLLLLLVECWLKGIIRVSICAVNHCRCFSAFL